MAFAKLFKSGGSQAVRLPKEFRFKGTEVSIEQVEGGIIIRPKLATFGDVVREMQMKFPKDNDFPDIPRPKYHERPILEW
jgi:antitoxin VapB